MGILHLLSLVNLTGRVTGDKMSWLEVSFCRLYQEQGYLLRGQLMAEMQFGLLARPCTLEGCMYLEKFHTKPPCRPAVSGPGSQCCVEGLGLYPNAG